MTAPGRVELTVLGEKLTLRTEASPEYLASLVAYLEQRVSALAGGNRNATVALIMAALDITDELFRTREEGTRGVSDVGARLGALVSELERATPRER